MRTESDIRPKAPSSTSSGEQIEVNEVVPKRRRWWKFLLLILCWASLLAFAGLAWYASTDSFQAMVRKRMVAELERVTGGRVELAEFHTIPFRLRADIRNLTIHGRESASETPYIHLDRLVADINVISVFDFASDSIRLCSSGR